MAGVRFVTPATLIRATSLVVSLPIRVALRAVVSPFSVTVIDPDVDDYHRRPSTLAADIEHLNSDALRVVFQPVVRLTDHIIESHECLVRWRHPTLGLLRPDSFLRLIKSQELARTIDEFVVTSAIEATEALPLDGHPAGVSINLSPAQLGDRRMLTLLDSLITDRPDAIRCLRVEVSLRNLSRSVDAAKELLSEIRAYGIGLIVDDVELDSVPYGLIEAVHPVQLKLARTSVARLTEPAVAEVAAGIARFGQAIGCRVVAKGIETPALERAARNVGCECGQGYLYSRPRPLAVTRHLVVGSDS